MIQRTRYERCYRNKIDIMRGGVRLNCYQMLKNLHVIINNKEQFNFWEQEVYDESEFVEACLDVHLLLKAGLCQNVKGDEEKDEQ